MNVSSDKEEMKDFDNIQFDNITFAYENRPDKTILKNFSLKIEAGQHVALIGEIFFYLFKLITRFFI